MLAAYVGSERKEERSFLSGVKHICSPSSGATLLPIVEMLKSERVKEKFLKR